mmetsp:Transcript_35062/g.56318  ORF Transcript_35062/g.56318 Transcript_35062/m.56318 type:complete len:106 (+) Transcript_35062:805-1122(+)|eukprot:CAMPEP_0115133120 /NCGR_PEP_ID=MMETSP0227-20121206/54214_1 /TAXON_ID=89957 /ORGANISM="Polarella glacialis, Strain CCMP 1383" /LENGTH=105 /DNA_ID=CAMNT_0002539153 /DNA_START=433 /DNA_END=746 /DNA_ORIENTATION=+
MGSAKNNEDNSTDATERSYTAGVGEIHIFQLGSTNYRACNEYVNTDEGTQKRLPVILMHTGSTKNNQGQPKNAGERGNAACKVYWRAAPDVPLALAIMVRATFFV